MISSGMAWILMSEYQRQNAIVESRQYKKNKFKVPTREEVYWSNYEKYLYCKSRKYEKSFTF
jgi:hypothetical protein